MVRLRDSISRRMILLAALCLLCLNSFKNNFIYLFIGCAGSSLLLGFFSSCGERDLLSSCGVWASHCPGFSCGTWASVTVACGLSSYGVWALEHWLSSCGCMDLVALRHVGSSWTRDRTHVSYIVRWTLYR